MRERHLWTTNIGTPLGDAARNLAVNAVGDVFVGGETFGNFGGPNADAGKPQIFSDGFLMQLNTNGVVGWKHQFSLAGQETVKGMSLGGTDRLYVGGETNSGLGGGGAFDGADGYLLAYQIPEPSAATLIIGSGTLALVRRRQRHLVK